MMKIFSNLLLTILILPLLSSAATSDPSGSGSAAKSDASASAPKNKASAPKSDAAKNNASAGSKDASEKKQVKKDGKAKSFEGFDTNINWRIQPYDVMTAFVGDTFTFDWRFTHDVFIQPDGSCNRNGAIEVGTSSGSSYTFTEDDVGEITFICTIPGHCPAGQLLRVNVMNKVDDTTMVDNNMMFTDAPALNIIEVDWIIRQYDDIMVNVGDMIQFNWPGIHNAFIHPSGTCDETGSFEIGSQSGTTYTFTADDVGELYFACQIPGHCAAGQIVKVIVTNPDDEPEPSVEPTVVDWVIKQYEDMEANVGDTLQFNYMPFHNVYIHPSGTCDGADSIEIGGLQDSGATYTFTEDDAGTTVTFVCQISGHCPAGQILNVNVAAIEEPEPVVMADIEVEWVIKQYDDIMATVGDVIQFNWDSAVQGLHNAYIHPSGTCDETNSIEIGSQSGATYTFTEDDVGELYFACQIPGHCAAGQIVKVIVTNPDDEPEPSVEPTVIDWIITQYEDMEANVGDTLQFNYMPFHNVYIHPSGTCDVEDSIEIGGLQDSGATYTFTEDDAGTTVTFVCQIPGHCSAGQILNVNVAANEEPVTAPPALGGGGGFAVCFSGNTLVQDVLGKGSVLMSDLKIGDQVKTVNSKGEESYETVYSFGHYNPTQVGEFLQITTTIMNNKKSNIIEMSKDHLILLSNSGNDKFVPASTLKIGDELMTTADGTAVISRIKSVKRQGVYAPFTTSGTIAVSTDGIVASSFVTLQEGKDTITINGYETGISAHTAAYLFETIHRMAYKLGMTDVEESYSSDGISRWVEMPRTFFLTLLNDYSTLVQMIILIPCFVLLTFVNAVEDLLHHIMFLVAIAGVVLLHRKRNLSKFNNV